jgi:hypothetical protein
VLGALAQDVALQLAGDRPWQLVDEMDLLSGAQHVHAVVTAGQQVGA